MPETRRIGSIKTKDLSMSIRLGLSKTYRPPAILPRQVGLSFAKTSNARKLDDLALKTRLSISDRARDAARFTSSVSSAISILGHSAKILGTSAPLRYLLGWLIAAFRSREALVSENLGRRRAVSVPSHNVQQQALQPARGDFL